MRGFTNRAVKLSEYPDVAWARPGDVAWPATKQNRELARLAKRFAPRIVTSNETISGDVGLEQPIAMSWDLAKRSFAQGFACLWNIVRVLATRAKLRLRVAYHRVMQSRHCAWALAAWGWSFSCCLGLMLVVR